MENLYLLLYMAIMIFIAWKPIIVWVLLFLLFVYFSISAFYFKKSKKQTVFLLFLALLVFSFPAFKVLSSWYEVKRLQSMKMEEVREEGRVVQGLELPIGTKLSYRVGKHDFKDEDIGEIYFKSEFFWCDLKIDYISYPKSYTSTLYFYENDLDIVGNVISVNVENDSIIDGWWCEKSLINFRRKSGKPKFDLRRENYELASCKIDPKEKLRFGETEYPSSFYFGAIVYREENDSVESLMDEVSKKTNGKITGKSLMRVTYPRGFFLKTEWSKLDVTRVNSIIDSNKNILFFNVELMPVDDEFVRLGGCSYKSAQKAVLTPSSKNHLLNVVFEGEDIEDQCKKHVLPYKFIEK